MICQASDIVGQIAAASEEQSRGIEQVSQAVNQMDEITQQNAALVEQAAAAAQSLEEQAGGLTGVVSSFKVGSVGASAPASIPASASTRLDHETVLPQQLQHAFRPTQMQRADRDE